jgi:hypothetical protein
MSKCRGAEGRKLVRTIYYTVLVHIDEQRSRLLNSGPVIRKLPLQYSTAPKPETDASGELAAFQLLILNPNFNCRQII